MRFTRLSFFVLLLFTIANVGCTPTPESKFNSLADTLASELDLNSEQNVKLETIKVALLSEYKERQAYTYMRNPAVERFLMAEKLDKSKVKSVLEARNLALQSKVEQYFPLFEDLHSSLTAEQKQKLVKIAGPMYRKVQEIY